MSLLPGQILPQTAPLARVTAEGTIVIEQNWWLFLYNIAEQVLANGQGATTLELSQLGFFKAKGTDYDRQIADLNTFMAALPDPSARIAELERKIADLQLLVAVALRETT